MHHIGMVAEQVILYRLKSSVAHKLNKNQYAYQHNLSKTDTFLHATHD